MSLVLTSYESLEDTANRVKEENKNENNPEQDTNVPSSVEFISFSSRINFHNKER